MDETLSKSFIAGGSSGIILGIVYLVYKVFKHSSCASNCCGQKSSLSIDLEKGLTPDAVVLEEKKNITT